MESLPCRLLLLLLGLDAVRDCEAAAVESPGSVLDGTAPM
jgi:hypothetical protein